MIPKHYKEWIDAASYMILLDRWRHAAVGDAIFQGETGDYYTKVMKDKRLNDEAHTAASKSVGWDKR